MEPGCLLLHGRWELSSRGTAKGAGVVCKGYRVELRGGANKREGDVFITNQSVHYAGWGVEDAKVVCRMLG